ncbi:unnamed protein product [Thelazia callipaeda]|uniref:Uncharacterized protein n=1 Tax=Thelazia callipaeda TaxID=103827 RepID=A0A0N5D5Q8_THECL|nr:unnamed protein product [Thelazia callipaeda]
MLNNSLNGLEKSSCSEIGNDGDKIHRYTREEMLGMRNITLSRTRPNYLSMEFDNDEGKFLPEKWLEHRWICEGVENNSNIALKRKEKLKAEALDGDATVLSPQRRAFSSGCRAASPIKNDVETERLGTNKASWRIGAGFQLKNSGTEYKTSFHKNSSGCKESFAKSRQHNGNFPTTGSNWRLNETSFKPSYQKEISQGQKSKLTEIVAEEKVPEWLNEGPTSIHDMIELRGFDDDRKTKRDSSRKLKKDPITRGSNESENAIAAGLSKVCSREKIGLEDEGLSGHVSSNNDLGLQIIPSCKLSNNRSSSHSKMTGNGDSFASLPLLSGKLPNSDAEFAAIVGILDDADLNSLKESELRSPASKEPTGSRLSRFFATSVKPERPDTPSQNETSQQNQNIPSSSSVFDSPPFASPTSILSKILSNPRRSVNSIFIPQQHSASPLVEVLRVEDLERSCHREATLQNSSEAPLISSDGSIDLMSSQYLHKSRQSNLLLQKNKDTSLGDPSQQTHLVNKLNKFAPLQDGMAENISDKAENNSTVTCKATPSAYQVSTNSRSSTSVLPPSACDATLHASVLRSQYEKTAALQALTPNHAIFASLHTENGFRQVQPLSNAVTNGTMSQTMQPRQISVPNQCVPPGTLPNSFMPTAVLRRMTKTTTIPVSVDETLQLGNVPTCSAHYNTIKQNLITEPFSVIRKSPGEVVPGSIASKNAMDLARLAMHQQYAQMLAAVQSNLSLNWHSNAHIAAAVHAQALAAQIEQQRQFALAMMRGDVNQAQILRARLLSHQSMPTLPNIPIAHPQNIGTPFVPVQPVVTTPPTPGSQSTQPLSSITPYKYQNPLEKLLQSAGVPVSRDLQPPISTFSGMTASADLPSIVSRLPPTANCISVEELEKQFAAN